MEGLAVAVVEPRGGAEAHSLMAAAAAGAGEGLCRAGSALEECQQGGSKHFLSVLHVEQGVEAVLDGGEKQLGSGGCFLPQIIQDWNPHLWGFSCLPRANIELLSWNPSLDAAPAAWLTDRQGMQEEEGFSGIHLASAEHLGMVWFALNGPQNITKKTKCQCCKKQVQTQVNNSFTDRAEAQISSLINSYPSWAAKETF